MSAYTITGILVGGTVLLAFTGRILWALHKGINLIEGLHTKVTDLEAKLSNGITSDIRIARTKAEEACRLAGVAATTASRIEQQASDNNRATNAVRADLDMLTNVVLTDRKGIRSSLRKAGIHLDDEVDT